MKSKRLSVSILPFTFAVTTALALGQTAPYVHPEIVSGWRSADGNSVMTFLYDGSYYQVQDSATRPGIELGRYSWNKTSGTFSATAETDTNGVLGLSPAAGAVTVSISGNTLTRTVSGQGSTSFSRITGTANPIVGAWYEPGGSVSAIFLADGTYFATESEEDDLEFSNDGMERGNYIWDQATGMLTAVPVRDTNGDVGLSHLEAGFTVTIAGNVLTYDDGDETDTLQRVVPNTSPLAFPDFEVSKGANFSQSHAAPVPYPFDLANNSYPFYGEAGIYPSVTGAASPTLKIGTRSPLPFEEDDEEPGEFFLETGYASKVLLDAAAAYPDATSYQFKSGTGTATLAFPAGGTFPTPAQLVSEGEWTGGVFSFEDDEVLTWTPNLGYNAATHYTELQITDLETDTEIVDQVIQGDVTSFNVEDLLTPGHRYEVEVDHGKIVGSTTSGTGVFAGKIGYATRSTGNYFQFQAPDEDPLLSAPTFYHPPRNRVAVLGGKVIFTAGADEADSVQWFKNNVPIPGQTGNSLALFGITAADVASYTLKATNPLGTVTGSIAQLTLGDAYAAFVSEANLDVTTTGAPDFDFDKDGIVNLLEFLLGGNPKIAATTILPTVSTTPIAGGRNLVFKYKRSLAAAGITLVVEHSANLSPPWSPAVHGQNGVTIVTTPVPALAEEVTVTIPSVDGKGFVRLRATR